MRHPSVIYHLAFIIYHSSLAPAFAAAPDLTLLFPAGGQRGTSVNVTGTGTFKPWPMRVWVSGEGVKAEAAKDAGKLAVQIAPDAAPGVRWLRLFNEEGASVPRPFVVGTVTEVEEKEPNNDIGQAQKLPSTAIVNARLEKSGDVDAFAIEVKRGQTLVAAMEAESLGSPMDGVLQVTSAAGQVLAQNLDSRGLDPRVVYTAAHDGTYLVRAFAFPATPDSSVRLSGAATYVYRLTVTTGPYLDFVMPLAVPQGTAAEFELHGWNLPEAARRQTVAAPSGESALLVCRPDVVGTATAAVVDLPTAADKEPNEPAKPQAIALPVAVSGCISAPGDIDAYAFAAKKGDKLIFCIESRTLGFPLDSLLVLTDAAGKQLARLDDVAKQADALLKFNAPADGEYRLQVRDLFASGSPRHAYRLFAGRTTPDFELALAATSFTTAAGKKLEIPVTVDRRDGFAEEIAVTVEGLPAGAKAETVKSAAKGDTAKAVKLNIEPGDKPFSGPIRIVGRAGKLVHHAQADIAAPAAKLDEVWLTITGKK